MRGSFVRWVGRTFAVLALVSLAVGRAQAAPLNLTPVNPDISALPLQLSYAGGVFSASSNASSGFSATDWLGNILPVSSASFLLSANIDSGGNFTGGTLTIMGDLGSGITTLLAGSLSAFGFTPGAALEFLLNVTTAEASLGFGSTGGVILAGRNVAADFLTPWNAEGTGDAFAVPEPATVSMLLLGAAGLIARRRKSIA